MRNAREALSRKLADAATQEKLLGALATAFGVDRPIRRVEVYDNSHIMGANAIGAMIVAGPEGFVKGQYRTFNIKSATLTPGDDYAMMREVLGRRFARLARRSGGGGGGGGRLPRTAGSGAGRRRTRAIRGGAAGFRRTGVEASRLAAIAKGPDRNAGRETFFVEGREPFRLAAARSRAVLRAAPARRGAPVRDRRAPREGASGSSSRARSTKSRASARPANGRC